MIRKSLPSDLIRGGYRFSEEIMLNKKIERDDDSKKSHSALVTIRYAIEHGTARLEWRTRIIHRRCAVSLPDEHAGPDDHRRFVADDDAGIWRRQARSRAVGPEDGVA